MWRADRGREVSEPRRQLCALLNYGAVQHCHRNRRNLYRIEPMTAEPTYGGWGAVLSGHAFDLQDWMEALISPHGPWVETWLVGQTERLVLRSADFEGIEDGAVVWETAKLLTTRLNGAFAALQRAGPLTVDGVAVRRADGSIAQHIKFLWPASTGDLD